MSIDPITAATPQQDEKDGVCRNCGERWSAPAGRDCMNDELHAVADSLAQRTRAAEAEPARVARFYVQYAGTSGARHFIEAPTWDSAVEYAADMAADGVDAAPLRLVELRDGERIVDEAEALTFHHRVVSTLSNGDPAEVERVYAASSGERIVAAEGKSE